MTYKTIMKTVGLDKHAEACKPIEWSIPFVEHRRYRLVTPATNDPHTVRIDLKPGDPDWSASGTFVEDREGRSFMLLDISHNPPTTHP